MRLALLAGVALFASHAAEMRHLTPPATVVSGVVFDSLAMRGLSGATVQLMTLGPQSTVRNARSDSIGNFRFDDVPLGSYLLGFFHPKLDSLGLTGETQRIDLRVEEPVRTRLSIPSGRTIARNVCGASAVTDQVGLLIGYVRGADNAMPRAGATVLLRWADIVFDSGVVRREVSSTNAKANASGRYAMCGVPIDAALLLQASMEADSSGQFEVTVPSSGFLNRDIFISRTARVRVQSLDSLPDTQLLRGSGRLRGKVVGSNKRTIRDARVTVWGTGVETTTNTEGEFTLANLPAGTHTLEVRAIGFSPAQIPVDIMDEQATAEVELSAIAVTLDTVRVVAQRAFVSHRLLEIERRQRSGMGQVFLADDIDKRNPFRITDLLRSMRGIRMVPGPFTSEMVMMRNRLGFGYCMPQFVIDNMRVMVDSNFPIDAFVNINDVMAVEVYSNMVPADFFSSNNCGVVAITTGGRPRRPRR